MNKHLVCITAAPQDHDEIQGHVEATDIGATIHRFTDRQFAGFLAKTTELAQSPDNRIVVLTGQALTDNDGAKFTGEDVIRQVYDIDHAIHSIVLTRNTPPSGDFLAEHNARAVHKEGGHSPTAAQRTLAEETVRDVLSEIRAAFSEDIGAQAHQRLLGVPESDAPAVRS